jgi:hypothetical protein
MLLPQGPEIIAGGLLIMFASLITGVAKARKAENDTNIVTISTDEEKKTKQPVAKAGENDNKSPPVLALVVVEKGSSRAAESRSSLRR